MVSTHLIQRLNLTFLALVSICRNRLYVLVGIKGHRMPGVYARSHAVHIRFVTVSTRRTFRDPIICTHRVAQSYLGLIYLGRCRRRMGRAWLIVSVAALKDTICDQPVCSHTSSRFASDESGALSEAMSDIFAASMDRYYGASVADTWKVGELVVVGGGALRWVHCVKYILPHHTLTFIFPHRYMNAPGSDGQSYDWYPDRYFGTEDNGGVHVNSGIMNLAFVLMVQGGTHPRGFSSVTVPAIDSNFDKSLLATSQIFYKAQTSCLTPLSGFYEIRLCTLLHAGDHFDSVEAAWNAVGVGTINFDESYSGLSLPQFGILEGGATNIQPGKTVTCTTVGKNGDAELYIDMFSIIDGTLISCASESPTSNESCTLGPMSTVSKIWVTVFALEAFSDLTVTCTLRTPTKAPTKRPTTKRPTKAPTKKPVIVCKPQGSKCKKTSHCCGKKLTCDGPTLATKKCKLALRAGAKCVRSTQCFRGYKCLAGKCTLA